MGSSPQLTFLGAMMAAIFGVAMFAILWWMLHPPPQVSLSVAKAKVAVSAIKKIVVPTVGATYSEKAVELACRLGQEQKAEIVITYVIEVPFTLPLNAALGKTEQLARDAVSRGVEIVQHHGLVAKSKIERARKVGEGIIRLAKEEDADLIVIGIRPIIGLSERILGRTSETLLRRAPCEVIVDRRVEE